MHSSIYSVLNTSESTSSMLSMCSGKTSSIEWQPIGSSPKYPPHFYVMKANQVKKLKTRLEYNSKPQSGVLTYLACFPILHCFDCDLTFSF